jgi:ribosome-binding protein aMBF1 (putative translation factor)
MPIKPPIVRNRITSARELAGWDYQKLATKTGIHPGRVVLLEAGHEEPTPQELKKISKALGVKNISALYNKREGK